MHCIIGEPCCLYQLKAHLIESLLIASVFYLFGNCYLVVFSDYLTHWPKAFAVLAKLFVNEIILRHGAPRTLLSDKGQHFMSHLIHEVCKIVNTEKVNVTAYHPETDRLVERFNATLVQSISMYVSRNQRDCDEHLQSILFVYRVSQ